MEGVSGLVPHFAEIFSISLRRWADLICAPVMPRAGASGEGVPLQMARAALC